jgi:hypothetical protein
MGISKNRGGSTTTSSCLHDDAEMQQDGLQDGDSGDQTEVAEASVVRDGAVTRSRSALSKVDAPLDAVVDANPELGPAAAFLFYDLFDDCSEAELAPLLDFSPLVCWNTHAATMFEV